MPVGVIPPTPRVFASIGQAWHNMWPPFWTLLGMALLTLLVQLPGQLGQGLPEEMWREATLLGGLGWVLGILVGGPLGVGVTKAHLAVSVGQRPQWGDLAYGFRRYGQAVLLAVLSFLIVLLGILLLIIPGIYLGVRLSFTVHRFVVDGLDAVPAIEESFADTQGRWWRTFGLALIAVPLFFVGVLALVIGLFVAIVLIQQMSSVFWRSIQATRTPVP